MKKDKFLTVYAVLDEDTQSRLGQMQAQILALGSEGTQTMGIPFHITLGSFHPDREAELTALIKRVCAERSQFNIAFEGISHFNNRVLFCSPEVNDELIDLHTFFDEDYASGFEWHPHCTLFCGEESDVIAARELAESILLPFSARVVAIELGEFFPTRIILREHLQ